MLGLIRNLLASKAHNQFDKLLRNSTSAAVQTTTECMDSNVVRADFGSGLICPRTQTCMVSNMVRADFGSGLICPRAQTCMDSNMVRADFGSGLICPGLKHAAPRLRGLRLGLQTRRGSNHSTAHVGEANSRSNVFQIPSRICLRAQPLESSLGRVPQAADGTCNKVSQIGSCRSPRTV